MEAILLIDILMKEIKNSLSKLDFDLEKKEEIKEQLLLLDKKLIEHYGHVVRNIQNSEIEAPEEILHKDLLYAIAELSGI